MGGRILLLEDDPDVAQLLIAVLHDSEYVVDRATTLAEAAQFLATQDYGLVITDWRLPDGDGTVIANRAADLGAKTAVLSGHALAMPREIAARHEIWMKPRAYRGGRMLYWHRSRKGRYCCRLTPLQSGAISFR